MGDIHRRAVGGRGNFRTENGMRINQREIHQEVRVVVNLSIHAKRRHSTCITDSPNKCGVCYIYANIWVTGKLITVPLGGIS